MTSRHQYSLIINEISPTTGVKIRGCGLILIRERSHHAKGETRVLPNQAVPTLTPALSLKGEGGFG